MSEISKQALLVDNSQSFPNNNIGAISPADLRAFNVNMIDSLVDEIGYNVDSASWNNSISRLNTFTSSQQPTFNALNSFTASQLVINTGVNLFTQSANSSITQLNTQTASFYAYTASINQIQSNGVVLGTSTRFNLVGPGTFFSASLTPNVGGPIATLTFTSDNAKLNTSSFNDYTASTAATQSVFSSSVATSIGTLTTNFNSYTSSTNVSIAALNAFTASDNTSQLALNQFTASQLILNSGFTTTSSFNSYTSSTNALINSLSGNTGSYATTGSNSFNGNQLITGSAYITSNNILQLGDLQFGSVYKGTIIGTDNGGNVSFNMYGSQSADMHVGIAAEDFSYVHDYFVQPTTSGILFNTLDTNFSYAPFMSIGNGVNESPLMNRGLNITGSVTTTGSVYGNIVSISIASQTASMDLTQGNFFTLNLVSGSTTHLTATNIRPGQTVNLLLTQPSVGTGSVSYNSTFDFPAATNYIATPITSSKDILTFITFDSSTIYATAINNLG